MAPINDYVLLRKESLKQFRGPRARNVAKWINTFQNINYSSWQSAIFIEVF